MESMNMSESGFILWEFENPPKFEAFWFEKTVDINKLRFWAKSNLPTSVAICSIYLLFIWLGPKWMKNREAFKLEKSLAAWNFFLSLFSLAVAVRAGPELIGILREPDGWYKSICSREGLNRPAAFWSFLYLISKIVELGDTVFIVLRKKPLLFLHGFHHFNMLWSSFFLGVEGEPWLRYPIVLNSTVHTLMYGYYGFRALNVKFPLIVSMIITSLQLTQFFIGFYGQYYQVIYSGQGKPCLRTTTSIVLTTIFGLSYLFMFSKLFYKSYISKEKVKTS